MSNPMNTGEVNTPTAEVVEPIVKTGGESATTFDELEALTIPKGSKQKDSEKASKSKDPKEKKDSEQYDQDDQDIEDDADEKDSEDDQDEESKNDKKDKDGKKNKDDELEKKNGKVKIYKVRSGDKDVPIPADSKLTVTVNGKDEQVSLQDVINNYSGKTDWNRKYTELDRARKAFQQDRAPIDYLVDGFLKLKDRPLEAQRFLGETLGLDMDSFEDSLLDQLENVFSERQKLSPEERRQLKLEAENARLKKHTESERQRQAQKEQVDRALAEYEQGLNKLQETHNITYSTALQLYKELVDSKSIAEKDITPEVIGRYHLQKELFNFLPEIGVEDQDQRLSAIADLERTYRANPDLKLEDLKHIAGEVYGTKAAAKALSKKVKKNGGPANTRKPPLSRQRDPITFDDLDE